MAQRNTRLILRNDSTINWNANDKEVLWQGELGIEFFDNGKVKIKIGDGKTQWKKLPYYNDIDELLDRIAKIEQKSCDTGAIIPQNELLVLNCGGAAANQGEGK